MPPPSVDVLTEANEKDGTMVNAEYIICGTAVGVRETMVNCELRGSGES